MRSRSHSLNGYLQVTFFFGFRPLIDYRRMCRGTRDEPDAAKRIEYSPVYLSGLSAYDLRTRRHLNIPYSNMGISF